MAMYTAYYDASNKESDTDRPLVVVGLLSTVTSWARLEREWNEVLADFQVPYLHMREFAPCTKVFASWKRDEKRRAEFLEALARVTKRGVNKCFQLRLVPAAYIKLNAEFTLVEEFGGAYSFLTGVSYLKAGEWFRKNYPSHQIKHVVEAGDAGQGAFIVRASQLDNPPVPQPKKDPVTGLVFPPFQAVDLLAYEGRLNIERHLNNDQRRARESLLMLRRLIPCDLRYFDEESLRADFERMEVPRRPKEGATGGASA